MGRYPGEGYWTVVVVNGVSDDDEKLRKLDGATVRTLRRRVAVGKPKPSKYPPLDQLSSDPCTARQIKYRLVQFNKHVRETEELCEHLGLTQRFWLPNRVSREQSAEVGEWLVERLGALGAPDDPNPTWTLEDVFDPYSTRFTHLCIAIHPSVPNAADCLLEAKLRWG